MADKVEKVKKRKRNTDGASKPSKRVAIDGDTNVHISHQTANKWAPVIASTCGLTIPQSISLQPYTQARKKIPSGPGRTPISTTELLLHSSEHQKLDYTAQEDAPDGPATLLKHYVGVYDPETGNLEVMEARKMVVRGTVRAHEAAVEDVDPTTNMRDLRNDLGQTFGTKKSKKSIAAFTENAINPLQSRADGGPAAKLDAASKAMLQTIGQATAGMSTSAQLAEVVESSKPRPKANTEAEEVQQVYTVDTLIGDQIMSLIPVRPWTETIKAKKPVKVKSMYVAHRVVNISENIEKLRILRYMYFIIRLLDTSRNKRTEKILPRQDVLKEAMEDMPSTVLDHFRRKFTANGIMSKFQVDTVITHLCAMACLIDNFDVDLYDLQEDLHLETRVMSQYFMEIGAKILALEVAQMRKLDKATAQSRKRAKLRLPLVFPKQKFSRSSTK